MKRLVTLPNGPRVSLGVYVASWNGMLDIMAQTPDALVKGWDDFPIEAAAIRRDLQCGIHDRINRHIPGYGRGRKWDEDYQTELRRDARRVNDYASRRLVHPVNRLATPELQRRFRWKYDCDGLSIVLHNARKIG